MTDSTPNAGQSKDWRLENRFANLSTPWFTLIGEHIQADGQILDYWRIEKADSVIILPIQNNQLLLPEPIYRPGIGSKTLDFSGGRCPKEQNPADVAKQILQRELGISIEMLQDLEPLNTEGWAVNSAFSNQQLYGFVAQLGPGPVSKVGSTYAVTSDGMGSLLNQLSCLQCRMVLLEWWQRHFQPNGS